MITREQIRAGRAMLEWSQKDLAHHCGTISEPTIKLIETGKVHSKPETLGMIQKTLETAGLEFLAQRGVRFRDDLLTVIERKDQKDNVYMRLMDDIFYTMRDTYGEILFSFVDQSLSPKEVVEKQKLIRDGGATMRFLIRHGDNNQIYPSGEYRYLPKGYYLNNPAIVYGKKFAVVVNNPQTREAEKIIIISDENIADLKRKEFEIIWQYGEQP